MNPSKTLSTIKEILEEASSCLGNTGSPTQVHSLVNLRDSVFHLLVATKQIMMYLETSLEIPQAHQPSSDDNLHTPQAFGHPDPDSRQFDE